MSEKKAKCGKCAEYNTHTFTPIQICKSQTVPTDGWNGMHTHFFRKQTMKNIQTTTGVESFNMKEIQVIKITNETNLYKLGIVML